MLLRIIKMIGLGFGLLALVLVLTNDPTLAKSQPPTNNQQQVVAAAPAAAEVTIELCAKETDTITMPDGATIPIWGFANYTGMTGTSDANGCESAQLPGPELRVTEGDEVTLTLHNYLAVPTSILFPGLPVAPAPDPGDPPPPDGVYIEPTDSGIPGLFTAEATAGGGTVTYKFIASNPGTYLYESGTDVDTQVAMGLYGALVVESATPPPPSYNVDKVLVLSEIDPLLNNDSDPTSFDMLNYHPVYWLINGQAYNPLDVDPDPLVVVEPEDIVRLRYVNAGAIHHTMSLLGLYQNVIARDAHVLSSPYDAVAETIAAGQTLDAEVNTAGTVEGDRVWVTSAQSYKLTNNGTGPGGMMTFIQIGMNEPPTVAIDAPAGGATVSGDTVPITASATDNIGVTQVEFFVDSGSIGIGADNGDGTWTINWDSTSVINGTYDLTATATDTSSQDVTSTAVSVIVDNVDTPPTVAIIAPVEGAIVNGVVTITADATDTGGVTQVEFFADDGGGPASLGTDMNGADGWSVTWDTTGIADGTGYALFATATDTAPQSTDSAAVNVTVDTPPEVTISAPAEGVMVNGVVTISATATDDGGVTQVEFFADDGGGPASLGTDMNGADGWSVTWDTTGIADGTGYALFATATDTAPQSTDSAAVNVTVDNPPTVAINTLMNGDTVYGSAFTISATATDDGGVTQVEFFADDGTTNTSLGVDYDGTDGWSVTWDTTSIANGTGYALTAVATDGVPQSTDSAAVNVTVDNTVDLPPTVEITPSPAEGDTVNGVVTISATAIDDGGVTQVEFFADDGTTNTSLGVDYDGTDGWSVDWDTTSIADGTGYALTAVATDGVPQSTTSAAVNVTVDNPPTVAIDAPAGGAIVSGSVPIIATAIDTGGVAQVEFFVDGVSIGIDTDGTDGWSVDWETTDWATTAVANGDYSLTATATDSIGQDASDTVNVTLYNAIHVGDLDQTAVIVNPANQRWEGSVTITVHGNTSPSHNLVSSATVTMTITRINKNNGNPNEQIESCTTGGSGTCTVMQTFNPANTEDVVTYTVTAVSHPVLIYDASANHDPELPPDPDASNGTTIEVNKP